MPAGTTRRPGPPAAQSALWRNVYVAESDAQAEDELSALLSRRAPT